MFDAKTVKENIAINRNTGAEYASSGWFTSDFIPVLAKINDKVE